MIASWLPNVEDENKSLHTGYFTSVTPSSYPSKSWQVVVRYDKYYNFYCKIYRPLESCFPSGMENLFPDDRWKTRIFGVNDEVRNARRNGLDLWFRELIINPKVILHDVLRKELYEFLEVEKHKALLKSTENLNLPPPNSFFAPTRRASHSSGLNPSVKQK